MAFLYAHQEGQMTEVYTDGSVFPNPGRGGYAAIIRHADGREQVLSGHDPQTTNNRMEMLAVIVALEALPENTAAVVYSDSQYVVNGRTWAIKWQQRGWRTREGGPVLNRDLWERLLKACACREIDLRWVRGHAGHVLNERCDALALKAMYSAGA